jgi:hypothetical protein
MSSLYDRLDAHGPRAFTRRELLDSEDLFEERGALFYTPTANIPAEWVGSGALDVCLPIPTPSSHEFFHLRAYQTPRLWVDLLQRATGKLRWQSVVHPRITLTRYDTVVLPFHAIVGAKALLDALKIKTTGRADRVMLYYFGAIIDDGPQVIGPGQYQFRQELVSEPSQAHCRIRVESDSARRKE